jgi:ABC-type polysaccharide/polyol phosphate export permease
MTNTQLYLAIGLPVLLNAAMFGLLLVYLNTRFQDLKDLWRAELRRVEEVLDARLKHLEDLRK